MKTNLEIVKDLYQFVKINDLESIRPIFHKNIKWNQMKGFPNGGQYVGADEVFQNVFQSLKKEWSNWGSQVEEYIDAGETILVSGHYEGTFKESGIHMEAEFIHKYTIQDGVITKFHQYTDTNLIANAVRVTTMKKQVNNPTHGITLTNMLDYLVTEYGWEELGNRVKINCFRSNPSIKSSLRFLRRTDWAREEVEFLYKKSIKN
jgi:ketosteroid isomerase-like protein